MPLLLPKNSPIFIQRVQICQQCPLSRLGRLSTFAGEGARHCTVCRCFVYAKARVAGEKCPEGQW
jgi:hypothetical protein